MGEKVSGRMRGWVHFPAAWEGMTFALSDAAYRAYHRILHWMWLYGDGQCRIQDSAAALGRATGLRGKKLAGVMAELTEGAEPLLEKEDAFLCSFFLKTSAAKNREVSEKARENVRSRWCKSNRDKDGVVTAVEAPKNGRSTTVEGPKNGVNTDRDRNKRERSSLEIERSDLRPKVGGLGHSISSGLRPTGFEEAEGTVVRVSEVIGDLAGELPLIERVLEVEPSEKARRSMWLVRSAQLVRLRGHPEGEARVWGLLGHLAERRDARTRTTKGLGPEVVNDAAWLNTALLALLRELEV